MPSIAYASNSNGGINIVNLEDIDLALALGAVAFVIAITAIAYSITNTKAKDNIEV